MKEKSEPEQQTYCNSSRHIFLAEKFKACPRCRKPLFSQPKWKCRHGNYRCEECAEGKLFCAEVAAGRNY